MLDLHQAFEEKNSKKGSDTSHLKSWIAEQKAPSAQKYHRITFYIIVASKVFSGETAAAPHVHLLVLTKQSFQVLSTIRIRERFCEDLC